MKVSGSGAIGQKMQAEADLAAAKEGRIVLSAEVGIEESFFNKLGAIIKASGYK